MGLIERGPDGQYRIAEQKQQEAPKQDTPVQMEKISEAGEAFFSHAASKLGPTTTHALALAVIEGRDLKMSGELASKLHMEPAHFSRAIEKLTGEFQAQARTALDMDEQTFTDFTSWALSNNENANAVRDAILAQVDNGDLRGLRALGQRFTASSAAYDDESLLNAEVPAGARVYRDSITGKVMVSQNGQTSTLRQAIASGEARVSRRK